MRSFSAVRHVGGEIRFVGDFWGDGGVICDANGQPATDASGNTIARYSVADIDERDADLLAREYCGDERDERPDRAGFLSWMLQEGVSAQVAKAVADEVCPRQ